ncbi:MAG: hypothetical protein AAGH15_19590, partial [Myxococcota bacterium]
MNGERAGRRRGLRAGLGMLPALVIWAAAWGATPSDAQEAPVAESAVLDSEGTAEGAANGAARDGGEAARGDAANDGGAAAASDRRAAASSEGGAATASHAPTPRRLAELRGEGTGATLGQRALS